MSAEKPLMSQLVELLGISQATGSPPGTDEVVIITVRPQPDNFRPHNIALKKAQAIRLLKDLESLLRPTVVVLVACSALAAVGCSARVEVERTKTQLPRRRKPRPPRSAEPRSKLIFIPVHRNRFSNGSHQ